MAYTLSQAHQIAGQLAATVIFGHLTSRRFDMQTDAVQLAFAVAQMSAQPGCKVILVDGLVETGLQTEALNYKRGPQAFFSQRCHDKKLLCRRIIFLDASSTRTLGSRVAGGGIFHFHGIFLLEPGMTEKLVRQKLRAVFGTAGSAARYQFKIGAPDSSKSQCYAGQKCNGATGKLAYMLSHVGTTCNRLKLNEGGKRSRKAPIRRARVNRTAVGFAKGNPSNFVAPVLIWDTRTRRIARAAFDAWCLERRPIRRENARRNATRAA